MKKLSFLLFFSLLSSLIYAQSEGVIRGFVYQEETGEPVIFTNVYLEGTSYGASTDVNGYYQITKIPAGTYTLTVKFLGNETIKETIEVDGKEIMTKKLFMKKSAIEIGTVIITGEKQEAQNQVKISVEKITPAEIKSLPSTGGEADLAQYLQVLPGVVFTGDQGGQLYIRGGSPVQNKVLLDGMIVYNPFHSIGLFSVFDTDILRNADVYSGGFNAEFGGRISSVMDVTTRDGNKNKFGGKVSASSFGAKLLLEGPIKKPSTIGGSGSSFIVSAKRSYLDQTSPTLYSHVNDGDGLPFNYTDLYGKLSFNNSNGSKLNLFGFRFQDDVRYQAISDLNWTTYGAGANFVLIPGQTATLIEGNLAFSEYEIGLTEDRDTSFVEQQNLSNEPRRFSKVNSFNLGLNFKYFMGDNEFKYGVEVLGFRTEYSFFNTLGLQFDQIENTTELAAFFSYKLKAKRLVLEPSLRGQYYASLSNFSIEPRIGAKYNITDDIRFKGAAGIYSQNLIAANSDRDVVNLFYGFLSGPENLQDEFTDENGEVTALKHRLQKAVHYIAGMEFDISKSMSLEVEGYIKDFTQLTNTNRNMIFEDGSNPEIPDELKKDFIIETGIAKGLDFVLKFNKKNYSIWGVYSILKTDRWDGIQTYAPIFDRRHNLNFVGTYKFGSDQSWETSLRWNYGSALPFTPNAGFGQYLPFEDGVGTDYLAENPDEVFNILGELNSQRLTGYHRLDWNIKKLIHLNQDKEGKNLDKNVIEINAGVTNVYDRQNIFYVDRVTQEIVYQLPILPSLGFSWTF